MGSSIKQMIRWIKDEIKFKIKFWWWSVLLERIQVVRMVVRTLVAWVVRTLVVVAFQVEWWWYFVHFYVVAFLERIVLVRWPDLSNWQAMLGHNRHYRSRTSVHRDRIVRSNSSMQSYVCSFPRVCSTNIPSSSGVGHSLHRLHSSSTTSSYNKDTDTCFLYGLRD